MVNTSLENDSGMGNSILVNVPLTEATPGEETGLIAARRQLRQKPAQSKFDFL